MFYLNNIFKNVDNDNYDKKKNSPSICNRNDNKNIILKILYNDHMNYICFDCHKKNKTLEFIDIKNGIFLCKNCAKKHYYFPKEISEVINKNLREINEDNLMVLYYSGNKKLFEFISEEFPKLENMNIGKMFKTNAMEYYRQLIKSQAFDLIEPKKPNKKEGYISMYYKGNIKKNNKKIQKKNKNINNDNFNKLNKQFDKLLKEDNNSSEQYIQKKRKINNDNLINEIEIEKENEKENRFENKENKLNHKIISDNSDCETVDEDKKYKSLDIENEKNEKEIKNSKTIDKPIQNLKIQITSNIINLNQKGCIEMYPEALFFAMNK